MTTEPTTDSAANNLQITDIENLVKAVDYASEQGAYKGWATIQEVLTIRNKAVLFLQTVQAEIAAAQAAAQPEGEAEAETPPIEVTSPELPTTQQTA